MPFGGLGSLMTLGAGAVGLGSSLAGIFGGTPAQQVPTYAYQNLPSADSGAISGTQGLSNYNVAAGLLPQYQQIAQQGVANPYASSYLQNAGVTGQAGMQSGAAQTGTALGTLPDVQALLTMGFDPQNALYAQQQNQNQQQQFAMLNQSGVGNTPYGQGVAAQANTNFNLGWENQQLQRASTAEQGAGSLLGSIGGATNTGLNQMQTGAGLPYSTFQGINANALQTLGQTGAFGQSAAQIPQQQIGDYLQYLSGGTSQQGANTTTANSVFGQSQALGQNLGNSLATLGRGFGGGGNQGSIGSYGQSYNQTGLGAGTGGMSYPAFA